MSVSSAGQGLRPGVCTSSTRPSSPYTGQVIYETDTGYLRVWDGAAWDYLSKSQDTAQGLPAGDSMGLVKVASLTFTSTSSAQQINDCLTTTYNAYRVVFFGVGDQASCVRINLRFVDGTTPDTAGNSYWIEVNSSNTAGPTRTWASTNSRIPVGFIGNESGYCSFEFSGGTSTATYKPGTAQYIANGTANFVGGTTQFLKRTFTAYEGIQLYPDTGNWAGTIQVYGYRN